MNSKRDIPLLRPMLAVNAEPFSSEQYIYEVKWDGYRGLAYLNGGTTLKSRNLLDLTSFFPELASIQQYVNNLPVILDGEIIIMKEGLPSFAALQTRGRLKDDVKIRHASSTMPAMYMAFDVLYAAGRLLIEESLEERKQVLQRIITPSNELVLSEYIRGEGKLFAKACVQRGLEGVVAKKLDSPYLPGKRSAYWQKFRNTQEADLIICGYQKGKGSKKLGALVLGGYRDEGLTYQGKVGTGFNSEEELLLLNRMATLKVDTPTLKAVPRQEAIRTFWVLPRLVCVIQYLTLTKDGLLRHPSYKGIRTDKSPSECRALS